MVADKLCVELKSLKMYFWSYRNEGAFHEKVTNTVLDDIVEATAAALHPRHRAKWYVRGGIYTNVVAEHRKKGWKPPPPVELPASGRGHRPGAAEASAMTRCGRAHAGDTAPAAAPLRAQATGTAYAAMCADAEVDAPHRPRPGADADEAWRSMACFLGHSAACAATACGRWSIATAAR